MENERRIVRFAKPESAPRELDPPEIVKMKTTYLDYLWAGDEPIEAAVKAVGEEQHSHCVREINKHRRLDPVFDQKIKNVEQALREEWLPALEQNMLKQALKDSAAGGNLSLKLSERIAPDVWGKPTAQKAERPAAKTPEEYGLSPWFADPQPIDADWKELDEPKHDRDA